jgi:hypothetical protein
MNTLPKIFIQMASYRDPQLIPTLDDCIANAAHPERLHFCIAWQHGPEETFEKYKNDERFTIIDIPHTKTKGACWARNQIQQRYKGEEYTLQLDSHHRFVKNWDDECINMIKFLQDSGFDKPLLTGYIPSFDPENDPAARVNVPWKMNFDRFIPEGAVFFLPASIDDYKELKGPLPARFYSAHFCFTLGQFCTEVQHDPDYYFHGEEISIAVRAYTWGYDLFHPHKLIAWHEYTRKGRTKHWDDDKNWSALNDNCHLRNRKLFEMDGEKRDVDFGRYGFGPNRTLEDYEKYSGLCFRKRGVQQYTLSNNPPPNPRYSSQEEYEKSFLLIFRHCINVYEKSVQTNNDDDFWVVAFHDKDGNTLYRKDADETEIKQIMSAKNGQFYNVWREFNCNAIKPDHYVVWPHSKTKGWGERITGKL